uniref:GPS domain-containing protein n=1 Tax=Macrostomum lignano TaxID=282301 RepID=A0A1I8I6Q4_9PLAT
RPRALLGRVSGAINLALAGAALFGGCRRYGDLLHGLCFHAGLVGCLHAGLVTSIHSLLLSVDRHLDQPLFLPALYLYLTAGVIVCFRSVRYPPRRCGQSCTRLCYLSAHCLPWAACSLGLLPVLLMHKESTESALRNEGRCLMLERWAWLAPLSVLLAAPLLAQLALTCLLCAYKPYRDEDSRGDGGSSTTIGLEITLTTDELNNENQRSPSRYRRRDKQRRCRRQNPQQSLRRARIQGNGFGGAMVTAASIESSRGYYRCEPRLLLGRPIRTARTLLLMLSFLQAVTQLPHCATAMLQTVLRNLPSRQPIEESALNAVYWLHLTYFPLAGLLLIAFTLQLRRAFRITELEIGEELARQRLQRTAAGEVLQTTSIIDIGQFRADQQPVCAVEVRRSVEQSAAQAQRQPVETEAVLNFGAALHGTKQLIVGIRLRIEINWCNQTIGELRFESQTKLQISTWALQSWSVTNSEWKLFGASSPKISFTKWLYLRSCSCSFAAVTTLPLSSSSEEADEDVDEEDELEAASAAAVVLLRSCCCCCCWVLCITDAVATFTGGGKYDGAEAFAALEAPELEFEDAAAAAAAARPLTSCENPRGDAATGSEAPPDREASCCGSFFGRCSMNWRMSSSRGPPDAVGCTGVRLATCLATVTWLCFAGPNVVIAELLLLVEPCCCCCLDLARSCSIRAFISCHCWRWARSRGGSGGGMEGRDFLLEGDDEGFKAEGEGGSICCCCCNSAARAALKAADSASTLRRSSGVRGTVLPLLNNTLRGCGEGDGASFASSSTRSCCSGSNLNSSITSTPTSPASSSVHSSASSSELTVVSDFKYSISKGPSSNTSTELMPSSAETEAVESFSPRFLLLAAVVIVFVTTATGSVFVASVATAVIAVALAFEQKIELAADATVCSSGCCCESAAEDSNLTFLLLLLLLRLLSIIISPSACSDSSACRTCRLFGDKFRGFLSQSSSWQRFVRLLLGNTSFSLLCRFIRTVVFNAHTALPAVEFSLLRHSGQRRIQAADAPQSRRFGSQIANFNWRPSGIRSRCYRRRIFIALANRMIDQQTDQYAGGTEHRMDRLFRLRLRRRRPQLPARLASLRVGRKADNWAKLFQRRKRRKTKALCWRSCQYCRGSANRLNRSRPRAQSHAWPFCCFFCCCRFFRPSSQSSSELLVRSLSSLASSPPRLDEATTPPMSFPVYTVQQQKLTDQLQRAGNHRVLHSNHTSNCHYSASLIGSAGFYGSISLCGNDGSSVEGFLPINLTHSGYIYPMSAGETGAQLRHRINIYPQSMLRSDWISLDSAYAKLAESELDQNQPSLSAESMLNFLPNRLKRLLRKKRAAEYTVRLDSPPEPHVVTKAGPFLMELYLIADRDFRFRSFNLHIAVTGLEIWKEPLTNYDLSSFSDPRKTVDSLMSYAASFPLEWRFDCIHLLHGRSTYYNGKSAGMAKEATMCSRPFCVGFSIVTRDSRNSATAGIIMSHELAHNLGSGHDEETPNCRCPASACIMSANLFGSPLHQLPWSDCSTAALKAFLDSGIRHCLLDPAPVGKDGRLRLNEPVLGGGGWPSRCGNGLVEPGEACDCGGEHGCEGNPCCVAATCQLAHNATCATAGGECDLSEHCDGVADSCPADVWQLDGTACDGGENFCRQGRCPSADSACRTVWGPGSRSQGADCYALNVEYPDSAHIFGCKFGRIGTVTTVREMCPQSGPGSGRIGSSGHARCGRLMCRSPTGFSAGASAAAGLYNQLVSDIDGPGGHLGHATGQARLPGYHTPISHAANGAVCRAVLYDYGPLVRDPGLVPDGVGCGTAADPDRVCLSGRCLRAGDFRQNSLEEASTPGRSKSVLAASARACLAAGGKVNSRGNCHCPRGLAPPDCLAPGAGGSVDSGPATVGFESGRDGATGSGSQGAGAIAGIVIVTLLLLAGAAVSVALLARRNGRVKSRLGDLPCLPAVFSKKHRRPAANLAAGRGAGVTAAPAVAAKDQADRTYTDGQLTDRSAVPPQVRQPKRTTLRPPPTPPQQPSMIYGLGLGQQPQRSSGQLHSTVV